MIEPVKIPPGHPWSCPGCQVTASVIRHGGHTEVHLGHDDDCATFTARLRTLAPELETATALTIRPGAQVDREQVDALFPVL